MSIQPGLVDSPGTVEGINASLSDIRRRVSVLEAARTILREGAIPGSVLQPGTITGQHIAAGSINAGMLEAGSITAELIAAGAINSGHIQAASIGTVHLQADSVSATHLQASSVSATHIQAGAVTATKLSADAIDGKTITGATIRTAVSGQRVEISSTGIIGIGAAGATKFQFDTTTGILTASGVFNTEPGSTIAAAHLSGQITETQITDDAISSPKIAANAVSAEHIASISLTTLQATIINLSTLSADLGTIQAGNISGVSITGSTITGATIRTSATSPRAEMTSDGITVRVNDTASGVTVLLPADPASSPLFRGRIIAEAGLESNAATTYPAPAGAKIRWRGTDSSERAAISGTLAGYPNQVSGHNLSGLTGTPGTQGAAGAVRAYATEALSYNALILLDTPWGYYRLGWPTLTDTSGNSRAAFSRGAYGDGPRNPGAAVNLGSGYTWKDPGNFSQDITSPARIQSSDNSYALVQSVPQGSITAYLAATNYGFNLPLGAKVEGIKVEIERHGDGQTQDGSVKLIKGNAIVGGERGQGGSWPTSDAVATYGGETDLWGTTWTREEINSAGFGVGIAAVTYNSHVARVDHIKITVYYTTGDVGSASALVTGGDAASALRVTSGLGGAYMNSTASFAPAGNFSAELWASSVPVAGAVDEYVLHSASLRLSWTATQRFYRLEALIGGTWRTITTNVLPGVRDHLVATYDGATLRFYINGALAGSTAATGVLTATGGFQLGHVNNISSPIVVDELALYTSALTQTKITDRYQTGQTGISATNVARELVIIDSDGRSQIPMEWAWNLANLTSFTIDNSKIPYGLNGNLDLAYDLFLDGVFASGGTDRNFRVRPNGISGSVYQQAVSRVYGPTVTDHNYVVSDTGLLLATQDWGGGGNQRAVIGAHMHISAKAYGTTRNRVAHSKWAEHPDGVNFILHGNAASRWDNGTDNITSLVVDFGGATCTEGVLILRRRRLAA